MRRFLNGSKLFVLWLIAALAISGASCYLTNLLTDNYKRPSPPLANAIFNPEDVQPLPVRIKQVEELLSQGYTPFADSTLCEERLAESARYMPDGATYDMIDVLSSRINFPVHSTPESASDLTRRLLVAAPLSALKAWQAKGLIDVTKPWIYDRCSPAIVQSSLTIVCSEINVRDATAKAEWLVQLGADVNEIRFIGRAYPDSIPHADICHPSNLCYCMAPQDGGEINEELLRNLLQHGAHLIEGEVVELSPEQSTIITLLTEYHIPYTLKK
ncbi:MAG: hypothetical protein Q4F40_00380 [Akkermansia sp.]|nr:hypothetical protein [Akkermansia sp.]